MSRAIDEGAWRTVHSAADTAQEIGLDLSSIITLKERIPKHANVQLQLTCKREQGRPRQLVAIGINRRMHLAEQASAPANSAHSAAGLARGCTVEIGKWR